jgi:hypothetical protein
MWYHDARVSLKRFPLTTNTSTPKPPGRALYLPTFTHFLIVSKTSLSSPPSPRPNVSTPPSASAHNLARK